MATQSRLASAWADPKMERNTKDSHGFKDFIELQNRIISLIFWM
jgi:hypothetical protein